MKFFLFSFFFLSFFAQGSILKSLLIQNEGRVKPLDTLARESLRTVYGKESFKSRSATEVILSWLLVPDFWEKERFILIEDHRIKKSLNLDLSQKRVSPYELRTSKDFALQIVELQALRQRKEVMGSHFKKIEKLEIQLLTYESIKSGWLLKVKPQKDNLPWLSLSELKGTARKNFEALIEAYVGLISFQQKEEAPDPFKVFERKELLKKSFKQFQQTVFGKQRDKELKVQSEIFYNQWKPFRLAWILYLISLFLFAISSIGNKRIKPSLLISLVALGFASHTLGLFLRSYIMSRPPVSNMYETVVWVPWVALLSSLFFGLKKISRPFTASVIIAFLCLLLTDLAPQVLDGRLRPLEAVLRSNFWLSTHVLIITMSYAFFFVAFILGDMALFSFLLKKGKVPASFFKSFARPIYQFMQWGVVLLTTGTLLGAIWADYSWGRFWGWDPKESWALISLLSYLAILHGKLVGWIKDFGLVLASVLMFFLIIMAWYGVNFILGTGLHSYGFGAGGVSYVASFFALHILLSAFCLFLFRKRFEKK